MLTGKHLDTLREVFASVCADFGAELVEMDGEDDHVQLLVAYPPHVAVARLVNSPQGRLGAAAAPTLPGPHPPGAPVVAVVLRVLSWWCIAGDLRAYIRQQRTPGRPD